ncbi:hypothetical protein QUF80_05810 [Desulfococcaceae bacterium HSG8]|nr:hypothetical protein [Desulfococcaceae bacterium HSG8]
MPIFKLKKENNDIENAVLIPASKTSLELEKHLECWLENSPWAIAQEPLLIIGRQTTANTDEYGTIFPDLLGIDKDGNLVIIELKKGRTPREVIAQLLEYAAWANDLSDDKIFDIAASYIKSTNSEKDIETLFQETFEIDDIPSLNQRLRLFVAAEEITPAISKVCRFLRQIHGVDVNCIQFNIFQTESGEVLINSESIVGLEDVVASKKTATSQRWSGEKPVKQVVWESVLEFTNSDKKKEFSPKDICQIILKKYPSFNKSTVGCQIISDSVNHTSRHHYSGGEDRYWWKEKGKYKLFDPSTDKQEAI